MERNNKRRRFVLNITIYALVILAIIIMVNLSSLSGFFSKILSICSPIIWGLVIAYLCNPILHIFEDKVFKKMKHPHAKRIVSMLLTYIIAAAILTAFFLIIIPQISRSFKDLSLKFDGYLDSALDFINGLISKIFNNGIRREYLSRSIITDYFETLFSATGDMINTIMSYVGNYGSALFNFVKNILLGIFISIYVLGAKGRIKAQARKGIAALLSDKHQQRLYTFYRITDDAFSGFIKGKIIDSAIIGVLTYVCLWILNIPYPVLIAFIVGITNVIPVFGPFIGAIPSAFIVFIVDPLKAIVFIITIIVIQQIDGNIIGPKILGNTTGLSVLGVVISITVMSGMFGLIGMIIGVPVAAVIVEIIKRYIEARLEEKALPVSTEEYYTNDPTIDADVPHDKKLVPRFVVWLTHFFGSGRKKDKTESDANGEASDNESEGKDN